MMDRSSGCGPCPWSCSGKVGAYGFNAVQLEMRMNCRSFPDVNKVQISASNFEDQRLVRNDSTVVNDSPSIGAGQSIVLFQKLEDETRFCPGGPPSSESHGS